MNGVERVVGLLLLGAWVGVDATAFLQVMVSQPLVAGWLAGLLVGHPELGLGVGLLLQLVWMRTLPLGGASLPLTGPAAVVAGALAGGAGDGVALGALALPHAFPLAGILGTAFVLGEAGRRGTLWIRRRRLALVERAVAAAEAGEAAGVIRANRRGALTEAGLGAVLVAVGLVLGRGVLLVADRLPVIDPLWVALPLVGLGLGQTISLSGRWGWVAVWFVAALLVLGRGMLG